MAPPLADLVIRARQGDLDAFAQLVSATHTMVYGVARSILRDPALAQDAAQQAYLRAYRRLRDLEHPAAFAGWLRRTAITVALNIRRSRRVTFLQLDAAAEVPVLDEAETHWCDAQWQRLSAALLMLTSEERRLCDRRYHGRWSTARLAAAAGVGEATVRKRLQRVRDKLRKEMEMNEARHIPPGEMREDLPAQIVELLARPRLIDLPDNPVGEVHDLVRATFPEFAERVLPEVVDLSGVRQSSAGDAIYVEAHELHRLDGDRILRYDLTLPLLLAVRYDGAPIRTWASGKAYRRGRIDATHLEAFHQAEVFWLDERTAIDPWLVTARALRSVDAVLPGRSVKLTPTKFPMCSQAWELEIDDDGRWIEVMAFGVFTHRIVRQVGGDPERHACVGIGYGLERFAMLRHGIDDIRKIEVARVA